MEYLFSPCVVIRQGFSIDQLKQKHFNKKKMQIRLNCKNAKYEKFTDQRVEKMGKSFAEVVLARS
jgi:hypothetical protein